MGDTIKKEERMEGNRHFEDAVYAQFVVGRLIGKEVKELEKHVQTGCQSCEEALNWHRHLKQMVQRDQQYEPPSSALESVMNAYRLRKPEKVNLVSVIAKTLFDSFQQPLPAGARQSMITERQVLYEAGGMMLDLKVEKTNDEGEHVIIGQLVPQDSSSVKSFDGFDVQLSEGDQVIQATKSNDLGEFVFHIVPRRQYELEIQLPDSKTIVLSNVPTADGSSVKKPN
jgi:hypothetical protein